MTATSVRLAVIGTGFIAQTYHFPALGQLNDARIVALAYEHNHQRALEVSRALGLTPDDCYSDAYQVMRREDVDAVLILTPNDTHLPLAEAAAESGKHMLIQKPLALSVAEGERMIAAAKKAGVVLAMSLMHRYFPEVRAARRYLKDGVIGELQTLRIRNAVKASNWAEWFHSLERVGGGAAIDVGVHGIDTLRYLTSAEIDTVQARAHTFTPVRRLALDRGGPSSVTATNEDFAIAIYELNNGTLAMHEISWNENAPPRRFEAELRGSSGAILVRAGLGAPLAVSSSSLGASDSWLLPLLPYECPGVVQHRAFIDAVLGRAPVEASGEDGLASLRVVHAMQRSFLSGRVEVVAES